MSETPAYVKNLKKESVVQSVINCLTDAMRSKELKPGDRIPPEPAGRLYGRCTQLRAGGHQDPVVSGCAGE